MFLIFWVVVLKKFGVSKIFLTNRTKSKAEGIKKIHSDIEILAVGIGHDVTRYYKRAIKITDVQELGDVMINQLTKLFSEKTYKTIH